MPKSLRPPKSRRKVRGRQAAVDPELLPYLRDREEEECQGIPFLKTYPKAADQWTDAVGELRRSFYEPLKAAWPTVRAAVLADWKRLNPSRRPSCWWLFDWNGELAYLERHQIEPPEMDYNPTFGVQEMGIWRPVRYAAWMRWRDASA